jgi:hypothetical protein
VTLVVRDAQAVPPRPDLELQAGDTVFLLGVDYEPALGEAFTS